MFATKIKFQNQDLPNVIKMAELPLPTNINFGRRNLKMLFLATRRSLIWKDLMVYISVGEICVMPDKCGTIETTALGA